MHLLQLLIADLVVGVVLVAAVSTLLEHTVLSHTMRDPVRSHLVSLACAWFLSSLVIFLLMPWRPEVPTIFLVAAIPVAIVQVRRGKAERKRIGYTRKKG